MRIRIPNTGAKEPLLAFNLGNICRGSSYKTQEVHTNFFLCNFLNKNKKPNKNEKAVLRIRCFFDPWIREWEKESGSQIIFFESLETVFRAKNTEII